MRACSRGLSTQRNPSIHGDSAEREVLAFRGHGAERGNSAIGALVADRGNSAIGALGADRGNSAIGALVADRGNSAIGALGADRGVPSPPLFRAVMCASLLLLATASGAVAKTLKFAGTSVKELSAPGEKWSDQLPAVLNDPGKGFKYVGSGDEIGVTLLDAPVPASTKKLFDAQPGSSTSAQISELSKSENPWILRYSGERGKPYLAQFGRKKFIGNEFIQEQRIRVQAAGGGAQCLSACKVEAHAFTLSGGKMVHVYWVRSMMRDAKTQPDAALLKDLATKFRATLSSIRWE